MKDRIEVWIEKADLYAFFVVDANIYGQVNRKIKLNAVTPFAVGFTTLKTQF